MKKSKILAAAGVCVMLLASAGNVFAQNGGAPEACAGDSVTGTLLSFDESTGTAVILTETGECTVQVNSSDFTHPIVRLFDDFANKNGGLQLADKLTAVEGWILQDPATGSWSWVAEGTAGAVQGQVTGVTDNGDGTYTLTVRNPLGEAVTAVTQDAALAARLESGLAGLEMQWDLKTDDEGNSVLKSFGDEIEAYHDDGIGFGVLAKLMGITLETSKNCAGSSGATSDAQCSMTLGDLVQMKQDGMGIGQIFKEVVKPAILGVGHIRQALDESAVDEAPLPEKQPGKPEKSGLESLPGAEDSIVGDDPEMAGETLMPETDQPGNDGQQANPGISDEKKNNKGININNGKNTPGWLKNSIQPGKSGKKK